MSPSSSLINFNGYNEANPHQLGIGLDSCVLPVPNSDFLLVQTTDFFYPLVDDPYLMGKITCANVLSDLYAMGVSECNNMLMLMGISNKFSEKERDVVVPLIMAGFKDLALEAGTSINGGQTVLNPWMTIGGVATVVCRKDQVIMPVNAKPGDVLLLTKPLGIQMAVNLHQWLDEGEKWKKVEHVVTREEAEEYYQMAMSSMSRLNRKGASLLHKYEAHAATDVTGFGILGHSNNLAQTQKLPVSFILHKLPIIKGMAKVAKAYGHPFSTKLFSGVAAETSGGLLAAMTKENAENFIKEIRKEEGQDAWIIGEVVEGDRSAKLDPEPELIEVTVKFKQKSLMSDEIKHTNKI